MHVVSVVVRRVHAEAAGRGGARHDGDARGGHGDGRRLLLLLHGRRHRRGAPGSYGVVAHCLQVDGRGFARVEQRLGAVLAEGVGALWEGALVQVVEGAVGLALFEGGPVED